MAIVKSFSVGNGDTFYIKHGVDSFSIIDCNLISDRKEEIVNEIICEANEKAITRFISTHPDEDHIHGIEYLDENIRIRNFYCVKSNISKKEESISFKHYKNLHDGNVAFYVSKNCKRRWINESSDERKGAGINILWPDIENQHYKEALKDTAEGDNLNNISIVVRYGICDGPSFCWFGDLETEFMKKISDSIDLRDSDVIFAPHHGRKSGRLPKAWLKKLNPKIIVIGNADSNNLESLLSH